MFQPKFKLILKFNIKMKSEKCPLKIFICILRYFFKCIKKANYYFRRKLNLVFNAIKK